MALVKIEIKDLQGQLVTYYESDTFEVFAAYQLPNHHVYFIDDAFIARLLVPYDTIDPPYAWLDAHIRLISPSILVAHGLPEGQPGPWEEVV
jgi:hypothetical protein